MNIFSPMREVKDTCVGIQNGGNVTLMGELNILALMIVLIYMPRVSYMVFPKASEIA